MPLQKPHHQVQSLKLQPQTKPERLQERGRTLHSISELNATDVATPEFRGFAAAIQKPPRHRERALGAGRDAGATIKQPSRYRHLSSSGCSQAEATVPTSLSHPTISHQERYEQSLHGRGRNVEEEGWNARRDHSGFHHRGAVTSRERRRQSLQHMPQDGSYPRMVSKPVRSASRSDLRSYSSHPQLLANGYSMSGLSSSTSSSGTIDRRSSVGTISSHSRPWSQSFEASGVYTSAGSFDRAAQGTSSDSVDKQLNTAELPLNPVALPSRLRYRQMTTPAHGNRPRPNSAGPMQLELIAPSALLPTQRIAHDDPSGQNQRRSISRSAQQHHQGELRRARSESLAALTATQPGSCGQQRTSSSCFSPSPSEGALPEQTHRSSLHRHAQSGMYHGPPPQYVSPPPQARHPNTAMASYRRSPGVAERAIPSYERLSPWKTESEEAKMGFGHTHRADMKDRVRRANELELEKEQELVHSDKEASNVAQVKARGCFGAMLRQFKVGFK